LVTGPDAKPADQPDHPICDRLQMLCGCGRECHRLSPPLAVTADDWRCGRYSWTHAPAVGQREKPVLDALVVLNNGWH